MCGKASVECDVANFAERRHLAYIPPDVLIIHLDSNDLTEQGSKALILDIIHDLIWLRVKCPDLRIIWSTLIPHMMCVMSVR